jgi:hypothetical protein
MWVIESRSQRLHAGALFKRPSGHRRSPRRGEVSAAGDERREWHISAFGECLLRESGAPASTKRPDFLELGVGLSIRTPTAKPILWERHGAEVMYRHYFEQGSNQYSFDRFDGWADVSLDLLKRAKETADGALPTSSIDRGGKMPSACSRRPVHVWPEP